MPYNTKLKYGVKMNDIYKVLKYIKEYIEDPTVIKDPTLQKIYVGAAAKANKLSKQHGTHYVLYDPSQSKLAVVAKSNLKSEIKEKGLTKDTGVLYVAKGKPVSEVAPPGWEGTVKAMKKSGDVDNPWALAWWMKNQGKKSHKKEEVEETFQSGKKSDRVKQTKDTAEVLGHTMVGEVEEPSWDLTKKVDRGDSIGEETIKFSKEEMAKLHNDGEIKKDGHTYIFSEGVITEKAKRDYKDEYKKFQSSKKSKKYRAELNAYNRKKGTYGNGDGKDASHKGGKIAGFEKESVNRGRAEKSRLKKTSENVDMKQHKLKEAVWQLPKSWTTTTVDELDAELYRAGLRGAKPDFNKGTITTPNGPFNVKRIATILKKYKATKIKEGNIKEKALKKNPKIWVPDKFNKVIDKLPNSKITKDIVIKLAKKLKVDVDDALRYVSYGYDMDFGLQEGKLKEGGQYDDVANDEFGMDYDQLGSNEKEWVRDEIDNMNESSEGKLTEVTVNLPNMGSFDKQKLGQLLKKLKMKAALGNKLSGKLKGRHFFLVVADKDWPTLEKVLKDYSIRYKLTEGGKGSGRPAKPGGAKDTENKMMSAADAANAKMDADVKAMKAKKKKKNEGKLTEGMSSSQAKELLQQLGGNKFKAMTGAKDFGIGSDGLHFKIGRNAKSISHIVIKLTSMDLYDMKFLRVRAGKIKVIKKVSGVYNDMLGKIFTKYTGMYTSL